MRTMLGLAAALSLLTASLTAQGKPQQPAPRDVKSPTAASARTTASGIAHRLLRAGKGTARPGATDTVTVHYTGWTADGKMFDTSLGGRPVEFPLNEVIAGWTEGVQLMRVGEKRRFWIPQQLAYRGRPNRPAGMLVFDIELLGINGK
jgi:peptidylprolyl isomerase